MRITPDTLLERLREAGVPKADAQAPVLDGDVAALSALYRQLLGPRAIEIAAEVQAAPAEPKPVRHGVLLVGNLGAGPETRYMPSGDVITNLRLATTDRYMNFALRVVRGHVTRLARGHLLLEMLRGRVPAMLACIARSVLRMGLLTLRDNNSPQVPRRRLQIGNSAAQELQSCRWADQKATVHPAFAPPVAVI
ncbi:single-stranded DNA-binding protein [Cupriavidus taiwanensis]|nr:single-stranded DNA-binding protein [Cupriavidus taiwanensis]